MPHRGSSRSGGFAQQLIGDECLHWQDGPSWRARAAHRLAVGDRDASFDKIVRAAAALLRFRDDPGRRKCLARRQPHVAAALAYEDDRTFAQWARVLVLGGLSRRGIAQRLHVTYASLRIWEALFCDLRGMRESPDWIHYHLIAPAKRHGERELAHLLQRAFDGGTIETRQIWRESMHVGDDRRLPDLNRAVLSELRRTQLPSTSETSAAHIASECKRLLREFDREERRRASDRGVSVDEHMQATLEYFDSVTNPAPVDGKIGLDLPNAATGQPAISGRVISSSAEGIQP
jgi:hypothetical protein